MSVIAWRLSSVSPTRRCVASSASIVAKAQSRSSSGFSVDSAGKSSAET